jgi:hypothetical protein
MRGLQVARYADSQRILHANGTCLWPGPVKSARSAPSGLKSTMLKIITWNLARREASWRSLIATGADVALVQEAKQPPPEVAQRIEVDPAPWETAGTGCFRPWRTAVVKLSDRVSLEWLQPKGIADAQPGELAVSRLGTLAVAIVTPPTGEPLIVASMYAPW